MEGGPSADTSWGDFHTITDTGDDPAIVVAPARQDRKRRKTNTGRDSERRYPPLRNRSVFNSRFDAVARGRLSALLTAASSSEYIQVPIFSAFRSLAMAMFLPAAM
jgi:hypothetical protein